MGEVSGLPLLSLLIVIPLLAGALCLFVKAEGARWVALVASFLDLAISAYMWIAFNPDGPQWQFVENWPIGGGVSWAMGLDGIALLLIVQIWLLSAALESFRGRQRRLAMAAAVFSGLLFLMCLGLYVFVGRVDWEVRGSSDGG